MDVLANFRHVTSNVKDVKYAGFKTSKLEKEIKKHLHNLTTQDTYSCYQNDPSQGTLSKVDFAHVPTNTVQSTCCSVHSSNVLGIE